MDTLLKSVQFKLSSAGAMAITGYARNFMHRNLFDFVYIPNLPIITVPVILIANKKMHTYMELKEQCETKAPRFPVQQLLSPKVTRAANE